MGDIVIFRDGQHERTWVPRAEESWWIRFWQAGGYPAARWRDYVRWGGYWPRIAESTDRERLRQPVGRIKRKRTNYARWSPPE